MQKDIIPLPSGDSIDTWELTRLIAKSAVSSLRGAKGLSCIVGKTVPVNPDYEVRMLISNVELEMLRPLLEQLPGIYQGMTEAEAVAFLSAYEDLPSRPFWKPVLMDYSDLHRNNQEIDDFQMAQRGELRKEVSAGTITVYDARHRVAAVIGHDVYIRQHDAIAYLNRRGLRFSLSSFDPTLKDQPDTKYSHKGPLSIKAPKRSSSNLATQSESVIASANLVTEASAFHATQRRVTLKENADPHEGADSTSSTNTKPIQNGDVVAKKQVTKSTLVHIKADMQARKSSLRESVESLQPARVILRRAQVEARTGLSPSAIYDKLSLNSPRYDSSFPKQVKIGLGAVGWIESEINAWIESRMLRGKVD